LRNQTAPAPFRTRSSHSGSDDPRLRDGVHLQTVILSPVGAQNLFPFSFAALLTVFQKKAPRQMPALSKELAQDGYIFVIKIFVAASIRRHFPALFWVDLRDPKNHHETTDAYDSIDVRSSKMFPTITAMSACTGFLRRPHHALTLLHPTPP